MRARLANIICNRRWGERPREPKILVGTARRAVRALQRCPTYGSTESRPTSLQREIC
jgi:hypothetical protein